MPVPTPGPPSEERNSKGCTAMRGLAVAETLCAALMPGPEDETTLAVEAAQPARDRERAARAAGRRMEAPEAAWFGSRLRLRPREL